MTRPPTYEGGFPAILALMNARRDPLTPAPGEGLPAPDIDLAPLGITRIDDSDLDPGPPYRSDFHRKRHALRREFAGRSELAFLNAFLIAHLRKREAPPGAAQLFQRVWAEQGAHLLGELDARWLVSSVTTFGDHGVTPVQRSVGLALNVLFGTMKLYETERLYSGRPPDTPFPLDGKVRAALPMQMDSFSLGSGGLDINMLGRLWTEAEGDAVIRPLAQQLLRALIADDASLFRRLSVMRQRHARRAAGKRPAARRPDQNIAPVPASVLPPDANGLRWGVVATVKGPLAEIARFAAHHVALGAAGVHVFLDAPEPGAQAYLERHPAIRVTACTDAWWRKIGKPRPEAHQLRQIHNATRALRRTAGDLHWLAHLDVDEFLLADRPVATTLSAVAANIAFVRLPAAEALAPASGLPCHFKRTHRDADVPKARLQAIYPTFGLHLPSGFLSHTSGKVFARPGIPETRLGLHTFRHKGADATNRAQLDQPVLAHFHAPSWEAFLQHYDFRRAAGSYRSRQAGPRLELGDVLDLLEAEAGADGLRRLFDEVCADTPALRARLAEHGMLIRHDFDLDAKVRKVLGALP